MPVPFFEATRWYVAQNTSLFDFVAPTRCSYWNSRAAVAGYIGMHPNATHLDLQSRFVAGSGIHGVNVRRAFYENDPSFEEGVLANLVLTNMTSQYEGFLADICASFHSPKTRAKELQFPSTGVAGNRMRGVKEALKDMAANPSPEMSAMFPPVQRTSPKHSLGQLDQLLIVFRYFKEIRNSLTHNGGRGTGRAEDMYRYAQALTPKDLGTKSLPEMLPVTRNKPVALTFRGVVGLSDITLRVVTTIDAELCGTLEAEAEFLRRWRAEHDRRKVLPSTDPRRTQRLSFMTKSLHFSEPASLEPLHALLKAENLIY